MRIRYLIVLQMRVSWKFGIKCTTNSYISLSLYKYIRDHKCEVGYE